MYYRDLILGGQDEVIYDKINSAKITRAFRKAAECVMSRKKAERGSLSQMIILK